MHHFQLMHILFRQYYRDFIGYNLFVVDLFYPHPCFLNECIIFGLNDSIDHDLIDPFEILIFTINLD